MVPILNDVGNAMKDKIQVVKIDTEKYPSIADRYKIQALPTFILFKDGEPCDRFVSNQIIGHLFPIYPCFGLPVKELARHNLEVAYTYIHHIHCV